MMNDVTGQVRVTRGGFVIDRETRAIAQLVILTNISEEEVPGPVTLAFDEFSSDSPVVIHTPVKSTRVPACSSGAKVGVTNEKLTPGQSLAVVLSFSRQPLDGITYSMRVLAGACAHS